MSDNQCAAKHQTTILLHGTLSDIFANLRRCCNKIEQFSCLYNTNPSTLCVPGKYGKSRLQGPCPCASPKSSLLPNNVLLALLQFSRLSLALLSLALPLLSPALSLGLSLGVCVADRLVDLLLSLSRFTDCGCWLRLTLRASVAASFWSITCCSSF